VVLVIPLFSVAQAALLELEPAMVGRLAQSQDRVVVALAMLLVTVVVAVLVVVLGVLALPAATAELTIQTQSLMDGGNMVKLSSRGLRGWLSSTMMVLASSSRV
jgi:uncharacterized membrane protein